MKKGEYRYERHVVPCACGCGKLIVDRDNRGRLMKCAFGHRIKKSHAGLKGKDNPTYGTHPVNPMRGKHYSEEDRKKYYTVGHFTGYKHKPETIAKMKETRKGKGLGKKLPETARLKMIETKRRQSTLMTKEERSDRFGKHNRGSHHSEEQIKLMSKIMTDMWANPEYKERLKKLIALSIPRGDKSAAWRGGKSFEPYTKEFNKQLKHLIRARDKFICQLCGLPEREYYKALTVHHINYNKSDSMSINLISLCVKCNTRVNTNRDCWSAYFKALLKQKQLHCNQIYQEVIDAPPFITLEEYRISQR